MVLENIGYQIRYILSSEIPRVVNKYNIVANEMMLFGHVYILSYESLIVYMSSVIGRV